MSTSKTLKNKKQIRRNSLAGTWFGDDSDIEYTVAFDGQGWVVSAMDSSDGEQADILEIKSNDDILTFAAYWNSTGRFCRCRLRAHTDDLIIYLTHLILCCKSVKRWSTGRLRRNRKERTRRLDRYAEKNHEGDPAVMANRITFPKYS